MNLLFLTQESGFLGPFAWVMGKILNAIYEFMSLFGIANIAICIVLFTFVIKMLMLPLTIKQQKGAKLSAKMNPELTKIQAKYKGKKDQDSMRNQQAEMQEVYQKYGTSPMGGCLPLLISLPIMFALYRVIYMIPAYVNDIYFLYDGVAKAIRGVSGYASIMESFLTDHNIAVSLKSFSEFSGGELTPNHLIDVLSKFNTAQWSALTDVSQFSGIAGTVQGNIDSIVHANSFVGNMNILDQAGYAFPGIIIPILSAGSQFLVGKLSQSNMPQTNVDNPAAQSLKTMNTVMPIVSGIFCTFLPIGVGIYWVAGSVFQMAQQFFINKYMDNVDIDEMIEKNIAKSNKKKEKMGIATGTKMAGVAKASTKTINVKSTNVSSNGEVTNNKDVSKYKKSDVSYSSGSISANANILKNRNSDKGDKK